MSDAPTDPLIGRTISQYEVVARIGGGGMGVVYKATDLKLARTVALKFLPPQWSHDDGAKQRFLREAQAASATNHRNICIIHDIQQTDDGQLFIVMAYYEGLTLKEKLQDGALPVGEAVEIATEVAEGLAKAHAQGVVHRDVKPGNLMITEDGVKVLDFGLAKFADSLQLTMPGSTLGTVAYMSPEQARGEDADARSDVWALGVVLYEMLSGRVPFAGAYPEAIFHAIKTEPVPLLSPNRELPAALQALVCRALEKDPERRYQSARELARDLRLLQGRTVPLDLRTETLVVQPSIAAPHTLAWRQRLRRAMTPRRAIAVALALIAVAGGSYAWLTQPVVRIPVAVAPVANHTGEPELDAYRLALTEVLIGELRDSPNLRVVPYLRLLEIVRRFISAGDVSSTEAIQAIATDAGVSFVLVPSLEYRSGTWLAQVHVRSVESGAAVETYETEAATSSLPKDTALRQMPLLAELIQAHFRATGPGKSFDARPASARFRNLDAARAFEEGLNAYEQLDYSTSRDAFERSRTLDEPHALTHAWLSRALLIMGDRPQAASSVTRARQLVLADTPKADVLFIDAVFAESQGEAAASELRYRELAQGWPDEAWPQVELADLLKRQNQDAAAVTVYREGLRLDARYARAHVDLCQLYVRQNEYPLAEQEGRAALEQFRSSAHRAGEAQALLCLGDAQRAQGGEARLAEARQHVESAQAIFESLNQAYGLARVYQYFGLVAAVERDYKSAAGSFEEALSRSRVIGNRLLEGNALLNLGLTFELLGQRSQALKYYQQGRDFFQRNGDARRAAEQEVNAAVLLIDYGSDQSAALRSLLNARGTFEKSGSVDEFLIIATEMEGASALHAGRLDEGRRHLNTALSLAKERQLGPRVVFVSLRLAESYLEMAEYEEARLLLEAMAATPAGRDELAIPIALGRVSVRLGDLAGAREPLAQARTAVEASGQLWLAPTVETALGELELESGNTREAQAHFARAAAYWTDDLPHAASVEARCQATLLEALAHNLPNAHTTIAAGIEQARKMGRPLSEAVCRVHQARLYFSMRQHAEGLATLDEIPADGASTIGKELRAQVHYWRSRVLAARGDSQEAQAEAARARQLALDIQASLAAPYRDGFAARAGIRPVLEDPIGEPR